MGADLVVFVPDLLIGGMIFVGLAGHLFGTAVEMGWGRRSPLVEDYGDPRMDEDS